MKANASTIKLDITRMSHPVASSLEVSQFSSYYADRHISEEEIQKAMYWDRRNSFSKFGELFRIHPLTYKRIEKLYLQERQSVSG